MSQTRENLCAVILAAGEGKRMRSSKPKVLLEVLLKPMLGWVLDAARAAGVGDICVVTGHLEDQVKAYLGGRAYTVSQAERKGTGHAVMMARDFLAQHSGGKVLICCGDAPFLTEETIVRALEQHNARGDSVTVISATLDDPYGYGRIIRDPSGAVRAIVEHKECTPEQYDVKEVNSGAYWFNADALLEVLNPDYLRASGITGEHYLTDAVAAIISLGYKAGAYAAQDKEVVMGANNPAQLHQLGELARTKVISAQIENGVSIPCTDGVIIGPDVLIGSDTIILPGTVITGRTVIGDGCRIGPTSVITDSVIGKRVNVNASQIRSSTIRDNVSIGPYSYVRPDCSVGSDVRIGDFVELKSTTVGENSFVSHMSYLGDCEVGRRVTIGGGCVTVNYDGIEKNRCTIGDDSLVGCNTCLIAPVTLGEGAYIAAGTTVTEDLPAGSMAIGRVRQEIKPDWSKKKLKK